MVTTLITTVLLVVCLKEIHYFSYTKAQTTPRSQQKGDMFFAWEKVKANTYQLSRTCQDFILLAIMVKGVSTEETRHFIAPSPRYGRAECQILFLVSTAGSRSTHVELVKQARMNGWNTVDMEVRIEPQSVRRFSRYPKLVPSHFFPYTEVVLYSDLNVIQRLSCTPPQQVAQRLLSGTAFGIVQHESSKNIVAEKRAIIAHSKHRPLVDSLKSLTLQTEEISEKLSVTEQHVFGIWGGLHAHRLLGVNTSRLIDYNWFREYRLGCDRDQIAFYAAAAGLKFTRTQSWPCAKFARAGIYTTRVGNVDMAIHCTKDSVFGSDTCTD